MIGGQGFLRLDKSESVGKAVAGRARGGRFFKRRFGRKTRLRARVVLRNCG